MVGGGTEGQVLEHFAVSVLRGYGLARIRERELRLKRFGPDDRGCGLELAAPHLEALHEKDRAHAVLVLLADLIAAGPETRAVAKEAEVVDAKETQQLLIAIAAAVCELYEARTAVDGARIVAAERSLHEIGRKLYEERTPLGPDFKIHFLKTWFAPFDAVVAGHKPYEIRKNDRGYNVGDLLVLRRWDPVEKRYTGEVCARLVTYVTVGGTWGLPEDMVVLGMKHEEMPCHRDYLTEGSFTKSEFDAYVARVRKEVP